MKAGRYGFNPCEFRLWIYLCGKGSGLIEAFSPHTEEFLPLEVSLPEDSYSCLFVHNNLLVVHSDNFVSTFKQGIQPHDLVQYSQVKTSGTMSKRPNSQPVLYYASNVFSIMQKGICLCFSMNTGQQVQKFT